MAVTLFAAIDVGSYWVQMKIFQMMPKKEIKEIDHIRHRIELGKDTYTTGKISVKKIEELCEVLNDFHEIMNGYNVSAYRACASSAISEADNRIMVLEYVLRQTGISIEVLDNSELRFLDYKSVAFGIKDFYKVIQNGTAIVEVGNGSVQVSLFDNDKLVTTQNIRIGNLRIREKIAEFSSQSVHTTEVIDELINKEIESFKKMHLKDRQIHHMIVSGSYTREVMKKSAVTAEEFNTIYNSIIDLHPGEIAKNYGITSEDATLVIPTMTIYKRLLDEMRADEILLPGISVVDGIGYDYAQKNKYIQTEHNFNDDIIAAARVIAKKYQCSKNHIKNLEQLALPIFDRVKKQTGLTDRDRLLLQIAVILHGCGKYISLSDGATCSYYIVLSTEIIGLSQKERTIIANVVRYNTLDFTYMDILKQAQMEQADYLLVSKLVAILRVANALDRSHKQKFTNAKITLKDDQLMIAVDTREDITLEKGLFAAKADYFEEVFHIRPVIRQKKSI